MLDQYSVIQFAHDWVAAWNSHDLDQILSHYEDDVILISPIAGRLLGHPEVKGLDSVRQYFMKGLEAYPNLHFSLQDVFCGVDSLVLCYVNQDGVKAGEFMQLSPAGKVIRMYAHYVEQARRE